MKQRELRDQRLADQVNVGGLIRHLEDRALGAFIPTRTPEAILLDAEVSLRGAIAAGQIPNLRRKPT